MKNRQDEEFDDFEQDEEELEEEDQPRTKRGGDGEGRSWKKEIRLGIGVLTLLSGGLGGAGYWRYNENQKSKSPLAALQEAATEQTDKLAADGQSRLTEMLGDAQNSLQNNAQQLVDQSTQQVTDAAQGMVDQAAQHLDQATDRYGQMAQDAAGAVQQMADDALPTRPSDRAAGFDPAAPGERYGAAAPPVAGPPVDEPPLAPDTEAGMAGGTFSQSPPPPMNNPFAQGAASNGAAADAAQPPAPPHETAGAPDPWGSAPAPGSTPGSPPTSDPSQFAADPAGLPPSDTSLPPADVGPPPIDDVPVTVSSRRRGAATIPVEPMMPEEPTAAGAPGDAVSSPPATLPPSGTPSMNDRYGIQRPAATPMAPAAPADAYPPANAYPPSAAMAPAAAAPVAAPRQAAPSPAVAAPPATYTVQPQDNYYSIAQRLYGNGAYFKALYEHNRDQFPRAKGLKAGDVISTPPAEALAARYPDLMPATLRPAPSGDVRGNIAAPAVPASGPREYVVRQGDTLFDIARIELGNAARWSEIYELNKQSLGQNVDRLQPGTKLQLPGTDGSAMSQRRAGGRF